MTVSEKTPQDAAQSFGGFTESGHPLYSQGDGNLSQIHNGMGSVAWGSFSANAYNRAAGLGSVAMGFNTIAGPQTSEAGGIDGGNVGQASFGWGSRALGNISFVSGFRNSAFPKIVQPVSSLACLNFINGVFPITEARSEA